MKDNHYPFSLDIGKIKMSSTFLFFDLDLMPQNPRG